MLIVEAVGSTSSMQTIPEKNGITHPIITEMYDIYSKLSESTCIESYHDVEHLLNKAYSLFNYGYLDLQQRSTIERLYWGICTKILEVNAVLKSPELSQLEDKLIDTYFCNFSIFQSLPDSWAINQVSPIMPIHRLGDEPTKSSILVDITCDSDGKIDSFIQEEGITSHIRLHQLDAGKKYYLGVFLIGAYQEVLGDIHNLFGDINAVHVSHDENYQVTFNHVIEGDTVDELLKYVHYDTTDMLSNVKKGILKAVKEKKLTKDEAHILSNFYSIGLHGYTYLEESRMEL